MKEFEIEITEVLSKSFIVKADNEVDAIEKAKYLYDNEEIILDSKDFIDKKITVINYEG